MTAQEKLTPEMLEDSVTLDEAALRDLYQQRIDEFRQPERRMVERLVFGDEASAQAAPDRLDACTETILFGRGNERRVDVTG